MKKRPFVEPWVIRMQVSEGEVEELYLKLKRDAEDGGYILNPDAGFTRELVRGLLINIKRYGYPACPCRLPSGRREDDLDIICPCDYRDADLNEYGTCYCGLYVSREVAEGKLPLKAIPERRPPPDRRKIKGEVNTFRGGLGEGLPYPVWRCRVCGYLCAREEPPLVCPICKASKDRFERFL